VERSEDPWILPPLVDPNELTPCGVKLSSGREEAAKDVTVRGSRPSRMPDKGRIWKEAGAIFVLWRAQIIVPESLRDAGNNTL
jgi:hypothetical protein